MTMGTLEDVEGRVSYEATRLGYPVWVSGQGRSFSPKERGSCSHLCVLGWPCRISVAEAGD